MSTLPAGTVTLLMTDVVGSTELWQRGRAAMDRALEQLDADVHSYVERHHGHVIKARGEGDSHFAVFDRPSRAIAAAVELQRCQATRPFPKVRAAIHAGESDPHDGDYRGALVNRTARLRSAAHGDQVICSRAVADLADGLEGIAFRTLGLHRIRDIAAPVELFQVCADGLPADFAPLVTLDGAATSVMTIVVADQAGSTEALRERPDLLGEWQQPLIRMFRTNANAHDGRFLKLLGDGCMVAFEDPRAALAFARSVCDDPTLRVRAAVTAGVVDVVEGELSGRAVFEAFVKVKPLAAGAVWASPTVEELVGQ